VLLAGRADAVRLASRAVSQLYALLEKGFRLHAEDVHKALDMLEQDRDAEVREVFSDTVAVSSSGRQIAPKSPAQKLYVEAIRDHTLTFAIGPAGTGKTYLAVAMAATALLDHQFKRIVLCRPAVEAGERLGFLPGDIAEKVNPYLRPLYDALEDMADVERVKRFIERGTVEIAPLAFMRGRTLNDSFVILDEAQNTTPEQMKMFLTRLGFDSKAVVTGDITQIDLPPDQRSGLVHAQSILRNVEGVAICTFTFADVVRHPLVARIIRAYEKDEEGRRDGKER
jgi:phosphate starvation-inducible PhoH-like protein